MVSATPSDFAEEGDLNERLVDWNVANMVKILKQIVSRNKAKLLAAGGGQESAANAADSANSHLAGKKMLSTPSSLPISNVKEIIHLPEFNQDLASLQSPVDEIEIDPRVVQQLHTYVTAIAAMYHKNPFHNFEHASHVVMSVSCTTEVDEGSDFWQNTAHRP